MPNRKPSSHTLRKGRVSIQNQVYLVTFVTEERTHRFTDLQCARLLIRALNSSRHAKTLAFVVMPDHAHWMIQLCDETSLSKVVQISKSVATKHINRHLNRKGRIWQDGFHDHAIRKEEEIKDVARYIVANPLRAGLVSNVRDYPFWDAIWI